MKRILTGIVAVAMTISMTTALTAGTRYSGIDDPTGQFGKRTIVKGIVVDSLSMQGEPAAVLQFFAEASQDKPMAFTTTDEEGKFSQPLEGKGRYYLLYSGIGKLSKKVPFTLGTKDTLDLGTILVQDDIQTLKGAGVVAQRVLVKMDVDKMSYDVENDVDSKTSTVLDMLRKVPMVTVDASDNISVNGSTSFQVTVDGKPNPMFSSNPSQIFKMMPASAVKGIQVITNPGVKYDAEGVGGVLNIEMARLEDGSKASTDGYYGSVQITGSNRSYGGGLFFSQQKGKWTMSLNGNAMEQHMNGTSGETEREQYTPQGTLTTSTSQSTNMKVPIVLGTFSASYEINPNNLISATAGITKLGTNISGNTLTSSQLLNYGSDMTSKSSTASINAGIDFQHTAKANSARTFTLSYQFAGSPNKTSSTNKYNGVTLLTDMRSDNNNLSMDNTVQADYTTPVGKKMSISTGAKFIGRHNSSDSKLYLMNGSEFILNEAGSVTYDFRNNIGAAYAEMSGTFGKFGLKAGARYEHTWQQVSQSQGNDFKTNYGLLVPTASIQYNIGAMNNIGLTYNTRVSRPGITYLNPYVDITDPTVKTYGNPDLANEKAHNFSLVYNYISPKWIVNLTGRYTYNGKGIDSYSFFDEQNILNTTYGNIVKSQSTGLNAFVTWMPGKKTRVMLNGGLTYNDFSSKELAQANSGWSYNVLAGLQQTLPWDIRMSANVIMMGSSVSLQGWSSGLNAVTLGLTKSVLNDRLSFGLTGMSNLSAGPMKTKTHTSGNDFKSLSVSRIPIKQILLNVSWSFGKQGIQVKKARKSITNDTQLNTASQGESMTSSGIISM